MRTAMSIQISQGYLKATMKKISLGIIILLLAAACSAQVTVGLTATRQTAFMPDGNTVPMWGWQCDTASTTAKTCLALTGAPQAGGAVWQPPLIIVPTGTGLTINLTNTLPMETSVTIGGQLGGSLGAPVRESGGPRTDGAHAGQATTTWPIQTTAPFTPPRQATRARSFVPEASPKTGTQNYQWAGYSSQTGQGLKPGTYLIETGTYPSLQGPMGLYGVLVVTSAPVTALSPGTAYAGNAVVGYSTQGNKTKPYTIQYDADVPLVLSEIDPVQNSAVDAAAQNGASENAKWTPA